MAKKKDGGAARAEGRRRVQNKRTEAKYGLQGFTKQAEANLRAPGRYLPTAQQSGEGIIAASGFGATGAVASVVSKGVSKAATRIGTGFGQSVFRQLTSKIKPTSAASKIKNLRGTVVTDLGVGRGGYMVTPRLTPNQVSGIAKGQVTRASNQAARSAAIAEQGARSMAKKIVPIATGTTAAAGAGGYVAGRIDERRKNKNKGSSSRKK